MTYGYSRVSTREQNTARQLDAFRSEGVDVVVEEHGSGRDFEGRAEYQKLRRRLRAGDTLVVMSMDRFGRNYQEIIDEWRYLTKKKGVTIRVLDMPILNQSAPGLTGQFLSYVAQSERERIHERQMQGIAAAKARGVRFGRPRTLRIQDNFSEVAKREIRGEISVRDAARACGMNRSSYHKYSRKMFADYIKQVEDEIDSRNEDEQE